ncbi:hypothetical protein N7466_005301 [Penicillium verhagenii]|uniref:uncharacterized protein n=1 Tax=Penicillium verhagenii TaxID=1562060 RepID=UPI002544D92E|nr:uncharacterized protein N7466_005301 [Penicillium verhagenii]KAJ5935754.1 hypothetical protein N7466_005301 [Penicillium verhagenii]
MRFTLAASVISLVISAGALTVTEPEQGADISPSSSVDVKWTSVDTDAKSFDIYLVNYVVYPNVNKKLASDISTSDGSHTVNIGSLADGQGYQINLMSDSNTGILAQTGQFNITGSASESSTTSSGSTTSTTSTASGTTLTGTNTATTAASGLQTSASSTQNSTAAATSAHATGAAFTLAANPAAAIGVIGGALALML